MPNTPTIRAEFMGIWGLLSLVGARSGVTAAIVFGALFWVSIWQQKARQTAGIIIKYRR